MERIRLQAKEMLPSVYLTLLSMIQALALETLWSAVHERSHLWSWGAVAFVGWLQVTATFQIVFLIWVSFTHLIIRLRWVMSVWDSAIPFLFGAVQFALIEAIRPDGVHVWFYVLAAAAGFAVWTNFMLTREASREAENIEIVAAYGKPGIFPAYGPWMGSLLLGALGGGLIQWSGGTTLAAALVGLTNLATLSLIVWVALSWKRLVET